MSHLLDDDDDLHSPTGHRELTLSTGTVLALFLGLALSWALFFGFGYSIGSKSKQAAPVTDNTATEPDTSGNFKNFKPSPGSPVGGPVQTVQPTTDKSVPTTPVAAANTTGNTTPPDAAAAPEKPAPAPIHLAPAPVSTPASATPGQTGSFIVQIAAFSHPDDAKMFVNSLHAKGYNVTAQVGGDNLTHVQIGPYNNRKEAESMKQQLSADGYSAMIK